MRIPNSTTWMEDRLDPSKNLKQFTIFNRLIPELRLKIWCHCLPPPGRAVFDYQLHSQRTGPSFHPDEDVVALPDNFFWKLTPVIFQVCQESRYIGKLRAFPVTGLSIFHGRESQFYPTFQSSTQSHPNSFVLKTLWFSPNDTIEIPIRSAIEPWGAGTAAGQIARAWVKNIDPLKVRKVQFSFFVSDRNRLDTSIVEHLTNICSLVTDLGRSATIFIGMGAGYAHKKGRFYLNDDQERWVYNEDGTFCNPELQKLIGCKPRVSPSRFTHPRRHSFLSPTAVVYELQKFGSYAGNSRELVERTEKKIGPRDSQCAVTSYTDAYVYCLNSEIIEEHFAKVNPQIQYVDQIRAGLVEDGFAGGWERGEAWRRGLSFDKIGFFGRM
ncbi:hypothetical protein V493_03105 [Pseudogymnoascus sp. VKM F-4281 (FW-2241)]|nr:hypothetical protein V493_03105 [Pseudogymnoascus sp. VKM F-4281 (FW-2241)]